jgi:hypothetical protein
MGNGGGLRLMFCSDTGGEEVWSIEELRDVHDGGTRTETEGADEEMLTRGPGQNSTPKQRDRNQTRTGLENRQ